MTRASGRRTSRARDGTVDRRGHERDRRGDGDSQTHHEAASAVLRAAGSEETLIVPGSILQESTLFLRGRRRSDLARRLWDSVLDGAFDLQPVEHEDVVLARVIGERHAEANLGFVDRTLLAVCERLRCARVFTLDKRLALYKPSFAPALELLP